jgi:thiol-disulfide isomerase/thioredoxin
MKKLYLTFLTCFILLSESVLADDFIDMPHVNRKAKDSYQFDYAYAGAHRAFSIAPGGGWSWASAKATEEEAARTALESCAKYSKQKCVLYAVNDKVVFDKKNWSGLWGPYKNKKQAKLSKVGVGMGQKFPDLEFIDPYGKKKSIGDLKDKVVFVHFWGCWCPSCKYEFSALIDLYQIVKDVAGDKVEFVILQAREPIEDARKWVKKKGFEALPISDSGVKSSEDKQFYIKGGKRIDDRKIAKVFPASYVLDKHGLVVFSHMGSISNWSQYVNFFKDAVEESGK